jgi:hypothetical protein
MHGVLVVSGLLLCVGMLAAETLAASGGVALAGVRLLAELGTFPGILLLLSGLVMDPPAGGAVTTSSLLSPVAAPSPGF